MWLIVSSLSPHNLQLLFCCVLSIFALTYLILMALFCVAIRRDSVSLLRFPFLSHLQVLSYEILFVCRLKYPYRCFSSYFCLLVIVVLFIIVLFVLFLVAVIRLSMLFLMLSLSRRIDASTLFSMLASSLPPFFLDTISRCILSLGCYTLYIVISFLVL